MPRKVLLISNYLLGYLFIYPYILRWLMKNDALATIFAVDIALIINLVIIWPQISLDVKRTNWYNLLIKGIKTFLIMELVIFSTNFVIYNIFDVAVSGNQQNINQVFIANPSLVVLSVLFFAPIVEETIFRYLPFKWLSENYSTQLYCIISAILFGLLHVSDNILVGNFQDLIFLVPYSLSGWFLANCFVKAKENLLYPIFVHFLINGFSLWLMT